MSIERDSKAAEKYCQNATGNIGIRFYGAENFTENPLIMAFLMGIQHARRGERERIKRFIAKYESAIATGRLSGGEFAMTDDMVIDEFLEQEAKDGN